MTWGQGELQDHPAVPRRRGDVLRRLESPWGAGSLRGCQTSSVLALPCVEVQLQQKLLLGHVGFAEVDVKCCVFTGSTFILNPEEIG